MLRARRIADIDWNTWVPTDPATLVFVIRDRQMLLIRKKRGLGAGKINGPGGAGQILGLHPNTLRKRMNKLGIPFGRKSWQTSSS